MTTRTIQKVTFTLSDDGIVSSSDFPNLGTLDDCQAYAELVSDLFNILHPELNF